MRTSLVHATVATNVPGPSQRDELLLVAVIAILVGLSVVGLIHARRYRLTRFRDGVVAGVLIVGLAAGATTYVSTKEPNDDPTFFCGVPDPAPVPSLAGAQVVQTCSDDTTAHVSTGTTIGLDLTAVTDTDVWTQFTDFSDSDVRVLAPLGPPLATFRVVQDANGMSGSMLDEVAMYRAMHTGQATISAVQQNCSGNTQTCDWGHLWKITILVI